MSSSKSTRSEEKPWIEKYRPTSINDVSSQEETVAVLKNALLPHLLFYGPPGTGKTSTILALSRQLFGPDLMKSRVLELNASDERGIGIVRDKIKNFAKSIVSHARSSEFPCPPYKIIILDEADSMTTDAQSALRRIMEQYSKITRIIDPLTSRCAKFRFKPLSNEAIQSRLSFICQRENVQCGSESMNQIISSSGGDMRKAVMFLQSAAQLYPSLPIPVECIYDIAATLPDSLVQDLLSAWISRDILACETLLNSVAKQGFSGMQLVAQLSDALTKNPEVSSLDKARMSQRLGLVDKRLIDGADEHMQLMALVC